MKDSAIIVYNMSLLKKMLLSIVISVFIAVLVTAALQERIFFSAFLGIPAGILTFITVFAYLSSKDK